MGEVLLALLTWAAIIGGLGWWHARGVALRGRRRTAESLRPENRLRTLRRTAEYYERRHAAERARGDLCGTSAACAERARRQAEELEAEFPELAARTKTKELAQRESGAGGGDRTLAETAAANWRKA